MNQEFYIQKYTKKMQKKYLLRSVLLLGCFLITTGFSLPNLPQFGFQKPVDPNLTDRITRSISYIQNYYYDPSRIHPQKMLKEGLNAVARIVPEILVSFPATETDLWVNHPVFTLSVGDQKQEISFTAPEKLSDISRPVGQAFQFIADNYKGDVKSADMEYSFVNGMLTTLDPHSDLLPPDVSKEFTTQTEGEYGGIGTVVGIKEDELTVIAPIDGTPASMAGIQADDKIVQIDDLATINMPLSEAVDKLRGKVGTKVTLLLRRKNHEPTEFTLVRKKIAIQSVKSKLVTSGSKKIGVVKLISFQKETFSSMQKALNQLQTQAGHLDGIVLDLRNNPGGLVDQALSVTDKFLAQGDILYTVGANKGEEEISQASSDPNDLLTTPLVVLVNEGSASASEIVSGALKGTNRALIMGTPTFGKGSVQTLFTLKDSSSLKLTIAQYLTPSRVSIQAVGIIPDVWVMSSRVIPSDFDLHEDETYGEKDLEEHLENARAVRDSKPFFTFRYLAKEKKPDENESEYTQTINEAKDYPLSLAIKVLGQTPTGQTPNRQDLQKIALSLLKQEAGNQDHLIAEALKKNGVDWTKAPTSTLPTGLSFTSQFVKKDEGSPVTELHGGDDILWRITATNQGKADISRLLGVVHSEYPLFKEKEFIFGKIKVGESKQAENEIKIPKETLSLFEKNTINFFSDSKGDSPKGDIPPLSVVTKVVESPKSLFAYNYQIKDDGTNGSSGNGNGLPEKGEKIALDLTVKNGSPVPATEVIVNLKNDEGQEILLTQGRAQLGELAANAEKKATLVFQIANNFSKEEAKLKLGILDKSTRAGFEDTLHFFINKEQKNAIDPPVGVYQKAPVIRITRQESDASLEHLQLAGTVTDDVPLADVLIFAGDQKIFYQSATKGQKVLSLPFEIEIPLKAGANYIFVEARDNRHVSNIQSLAIMGAPKKIIAQQKQADNDLSK